MPTYNPVEYKIDKITVDPGESTVRYIMVHSPMDHDEFKILYRKLGSIGIMVPMAELAHSAVTNLNVLYTPAGRVWTRLVTKDEYARQISEIKRIQATLREAFKGILTNKPYAYKVVEYCDGLMILEVRALVDSDKINCYTVAAR